MAAHRPGACLKEVYVARTEMHYDIFGVGRTEEEARAAVRAVYRKRTASGYHPVLDEYNEPITTDEQIDEWVHVEGPIPFPGALSE